MVPFGYHADSGHGSTEAGAVVVGVVRGSRGKGAPAALGSQSLSRQLILLVRLRLARRHLPSDENYRRRRARKPTQKGSKKLGGVLGTKSSRFMQSAGTSRSLLILEIDKDMNELAKQL